MTFSEQFSSFESYILERQNKDFLHNCNMSWGKNPLETTGWFFFFFQKPFNKYIYIKRTFQSLEKNLKKNNHSKHKSSSTPTPFLQCRAPAFALSSSGCILKLLSFPREGMCLLCKLPCSQQWVWKRNLISENLQRANWFPKWHAAKQWSGFKIILLHLESFPCFLFCFVF